MNLKLIEKPSYLDINGFLEKDQTILEYLENGFAIEATHEYTDKDGNFIFYRVRLKNNVTKKNG